MSQLLLSDIYIYPIKSLGGIRVQQALVERRGLQYDRRWMLVDAAGFFMTQRQTPELALFDVALTEQGLQVTHRVKNVKPLLVPFENDGEKSMLVSIWNDVTFAFLVNKQADQWFSKILGQPVKLVYMPDNAMRHTDPNDDPALNLVSFADAFPYLLTGQASLNELNSRLATPVPMNRFRPNLVFSGGAPFAEDTWLRFKIGDTIFFAAKPCARCAVITIDQQTAEMSDEPLRTLATFRKFENKVLFGQNLVSENYGQLLETGDRLEVLAIKSPDSVEP